MSDMESDQTPNTPAEPAPETVETVATDLQSVPAELEQQYKQEAAPAQEDNKGQIPATGGTACHAGKLYAITKPNPAMRVAILAAGWDVRDLQGTPPDLDLSVFMLNSQEKTRENEDFVFYNNSSAQGDCIVHEGDNRTGLGAGDDESVQVNFREIPLDVPEFRVYMSIYNPFENEHHFKMVKHVYFRVVDRESSDELLRFNLENVIESSNKQQAVIYLGKFERTLNQNWTFEAHGELLEGSLKEVAEKYDIIVKS